ncbi:hypothetical protein GF312_10700 [Candidatus Poribacteria bacterium]|nr:hypothetical protein [Candidatus Poribacteria bacterium]
MKSLLIFVNILFLAFLMITSFAYTDVVYVGDDPDTKGDWVGKYGNNGVIIFAMEDLQDMKDITVFDDGGNNRWDWENPTEDERGLLYPDGSGQRTGSCVYNNPDGIFTIETSLDSYQVAAYVVDWDSDVRIQDMTGFQGAEAPADPHVIVENPVFNGGVYHIWQVTGGEPFKLQVVHQGGANWVMTGIFVDEIDTAAVEPGDKLATTWSKIKK